MKKTIVFLFVFSMILVLSSCVGIHYQNTEYVINGYEVYQYDHRISEIECDRITRFGLFVRDGDNDYLTDKDFGECQNTLYVKDGGDYMNLSTAVDNSLFTLEQVLEVDWDFNIYATHALLDYTDVDSFVFIQGDTSVVYDDLDNIERVLDISESIYQRFIIDYMPADATQIGTIEAYDGSNLVGTLTVYQEGIFDPHTNAFQEMNTSEIHGLYQSIMTN